MSLILSLSGSLSDSSGSRLRARLDEACERMRHERVAARIVERDHTLWKPDPTEISNRLGWLDSPATLTAQLPAIDAVVDAARADGLTHALLLGMGGSSLAPEVFRRLFGVAPGYLDLAVLDSTDPAAVRQATAQLDPARTLFVPATKSGGTVETLSFTKYCYNLAAAAVGPQQAGRQFVAITDPGSGLADLAKQLGFRHTFLNDPDIGGRYSALSAFGTVPARLGGADVGAVLAAGAAAAADIVDDGLGLRLGAVLGAAAAAGHDKLTLLPSASLAPVGVWVEQLVAESTGKEGKGILPVDGEPIGDTSSYGADRLFVSLRLAGETVDTAHLVEAGHPVVDVQLDDMHDVGGVMFAWEIATIVAGYMLQINPFDQPDVEAAKILARSMMEAYGKQGSLPTLEPALQADGVTVYGDVQSPDLSGALQQFFATAAAGAYVCLQAYVPASADTDATLTRLRLRLRQDLQLATTSGYGPRFLHSTGQLHKGDAGNGLFVQITCDDSQDLFIPDTAGESAAAISFGTLKAAQALGDRQALLDGGRRVLRLHLGADVAAGMRTIENALNESGR